LPLLQHLAQTLVAQEVVSTEEFNYCPTKSPARGWLFDNYQTSDVGNGEDEDEDEDSTTEFSGRRKNSDVYDYPGMTNGNSVANNTIQK